MSGAITFDDVYNPSEVQRDLFRRIAAQADRERRKTVDSERAQILDVLAKEGVDIARRTVAKYREKLNIPSSRQRKAY